MDVPRYDERPIFDLQAARTQAMAIEIAMRIGMFEALREPSSRAELSARLSIGRRATDILLTVLSSCGLISASGDRYALTGIAREYLLEDSPFFKGPWFRTIPKAEIEMMRNVHLQDGVTRPQTTRWMAGQVAHPGEQGARMHAHSFAAATAFARHPAFRAIQHVLDVAGGVGTVSIALARANPALRCTVLDLPPMAAESRAYVERFGVAGQVSFVGKNMFTDAWPTGCDAVFFGNIFHDWEGARCVDLARKAFEVLPPGGYLLANEMLLNEAKDGPLGTALFSAAMLLLAQGQQMTFSEIAGLLRGAGFVDVEQLSEFGYYSLIAARKPRHDPHQASTTQGRAERLPDQARILKDVS